MISGYEMYVQLDPYSEQRSDCRLSCNHDAANFPAPPMLHVPDSGSRIGHEEDLINDPGTLSMIGMGPGSESHLLTDSSAGKSATKRSNQRSQQTDFSKRRIRHNFSAVQTKALEQSFDLVTHYPDFSAMDELSKRLKLPIERIQVWFQNRRAKFRRNSMNKSQSH